MFTYPNITRGPLTTKAMAANMNLKNEKPQHYIISLKHLGIEFLCF